MDRLKLLEDPIFRKRCAQMGLNYINSRTCKNAIFVYLDGDRSLILNRDYEVLEEDVLISSDVRFQACKLIYGLDFYLFPHFIVLETPQKDVHLLVDRNFNCFDIIRGEDREEILEYVANMHYLQYTERFEDYLEEPFIPFADLSAEIILNIACRIQNIYEKDISCYVSQTEGKVHISINKSDYTLCSSNQKLGMLCFIKFLGELAKHYCQCFYPLMALNSVSSISPVGDYLNRIAKDLYEEMKRKPHQNASALSDYLLAKYGYKGDCNKMRLYIEMVFKLFTSCNFDLTTLTYLANTSLRILDVPDKEYRGRHNAPYERKNENDFEDLFTQVESKPFILNNALYSENPAS